MKEVLFWILMVVILGLSLGGLLCLLLNQEIGQSEYNEIKKYMTEYPEVKPMVEVAMKDGYISMAENG